MSYFRPEIEQMAGYTPGEQPQGGKFIKLNTNENPYPASPAVGRAISAVLQSGLARYPDSMATAFRRRAGEVLGVAPDWILCGNGSDDILTILTRSLVGSGECLRLASPSYILYKTLAQLQGARSEEIPFNSSMRRREIRASGWTAFCLIRTMRSVPPAMYRDFPCRPSINANASFKRSGRW